MRASPRRGGAGCGGGQEGERGGVGLSAASPRAWRRSGLAAAIPDADMASAMQI